VGPLPPVSWAGRSQCDDLNPCVIGRSAPDFTKHDVVRTTAKDGFAAGYTPETSAVMATALLWGQVLDGMDDAVRKQIASELLQQWATSKNPNAIRGMIRDGEWPSDALWMKLAWSILLAHDWVRAGNVDEATHNLLKDEIYQALEGVPFRQRSMDRVRAIVDSAFEA